MSVYLCPHIVEFEMTRILGFMLVEYDCQEREKLPR
jgi:hypothetical protein